MEDAVPSGVKQTISSFLSLVCQLGDLLISYFKRKAKVKDTGTILPGHGGLLDRFDGIIFGLFFGIIINSLLWKNILQF